MRTSRRRTLSDWMGLRMNVDDLVAIDVHVHLEHESTATETDAAAHKYFGSNVAA